MNAVEASNDDDGVTSDVDVEGLQLLLRMLYLLSFTFQSAVCFELSQAYLHRLLVVYTDILIRDSQLRLAVQELSEIQALSCSKFRKLVHSSSCLVKLLAKLPPI